MPTSYRELSFKQYCELVNQSDFMSQLAILLKCDRSLIESAKMSFDTEKQIYKALEFFSDLPDFNKIDLPSKIKIKDKSIEVPRDLDLESFGQRMKAQERISQAESKQESLINILPYLCSIYLEPLYYDRAFDATKTEKFAEEVLKDCSYLDLYKIGSFFLRKYSESYLSGQAVLRKQKKKSLLSILLKKNFSSERAAKS